MHSGVAAQVLEACLKTSRKMFQNAKNSGFVSGDFDDSMWKYKGERLLFTEIGSGRKGAATQISLSERAGEIARCYCARNILLQVSGELAVSRLNGFRHLALRIGISDEYWHEMPISVLNQTVTELKANLKITSAYHRATALRDFITFLNNMHYRLDGSSHRFLNRLVKWNHRIPNPVRSSLELTSNEHEKRREELYDEQLHVAIAQAAFTLKSDSSIEPTPGYDRIRLESLAFALALGLRIGEICSLSKRTFDYDEDTKLSSLIVATEKGAQVGATAIAKIWEGVVKEAYEYLLQTCSQARSRAKEIEDSGFEFVLNTLEKYRLTQPLSASKVKQLESINLSPTNFFFIKEIASSFSLSPKEFAADGYYRTCQTSLPQEVGARIAIWFDTRFSRWDWAEHSRFYSTSGYRLRFEEIIKGSGASKSSIIKSGWFVDDLRDMLADMQQANVFDPRHIASDEIISDYREQWKKLRSQILSNRGGKSTAINIKKFILLLKQDYSSYLSAHFKEEFSAEGNSSGGGFAGNNTRPGMETKLSEHLIVVWQNQFSGNANPGLLPRPMLRSDIYNYLSNKGGKKTVFERLGILDEQGKPYSISPHQIRRWLTTALLRSGPNETAIDLWMGRKPRQTRHYDYRTAKERAEWIRSRYVDSDQLPNDVLGRRVKIWRDEGMAPGEIERLVIVKLQALHFTPWGTCSRELYISPCTKGLMCLRGFGTSTGCDSFQIDPADLEAKTAIIALKEKYTVMLGAITENKTGILKIISEELDNTEPLDQHIYFIIDVLKGCEAALQTYINVSPIGG